MLVQEAVERLSDGVATSVDDVVRQLEHEGLCIVGVESNPLRAMLAVKGYKACPHCGSDINVRCCEFGRDR